MRNLFTAQTQITINASKEKVWEAITNPFLVKQYFFGTNLSADWRVGGMIYFTIWFKMYDKHNFAVETLF